MAARAESTEDIGENMRDRILTAATRLLEEGGVDALTTRGVASAAGVQAPTLYRMFGDKDGMLDALAEQSFANYVAQKAAREPNPDPVVDLYEGWVEHVEFGLRYPGMFAMMTVRPGRSSAAARAGLEVLRRRVRKLAADGRLRMSEERAVGLFHAVGTGTVLTLGGRPQEEQATAIQTAWEATIAAIAHEDASGDNSMSGSANVVRAGLDKIASLSPGERLLCEEMLVKIANEKPRNA